MHWHQYKISVIRGIFVVFFALVIISAIAGMINEYGQEWFRPEMVPGKPSGRLVDQWNKAIAAGDYRRAKLLAGRLAPENTIEPPRIDYVFLLQRFDLPFSVLTSDFNVNDMARRRDALTVRELHGKLTAGAVKPLEAIFNAVIREVKSLEKPVPCQSIIEIWNRRSGMPNDRIRLLAELARFSGYETTVIYLTNAQGQPFYALAELYRNGEYTVADILYERLYQGALDNIAVPVDWHPEIKAALKHPKVYLIPAELADYRNTGIRLNAVLQDSMLPAAPADRYNNLIRRKGKPNDSNIYSYWGYPLEMSVAKPGIPPMRRAQTPLGTVK